MIIILEVAFLAWLAALVMVVKKLLQAINDLRPTDSIASYYHPVRQHSYHSHPRLGHYIRYRHPIARPVMH